MRVERGITSVAYPLISHASYATLKPKSWDNTCYATLVMQWISRHIHFD